MIPVSEAKQIIRSNIHSLPPSRENLSEAGDLVLAENVYASVDVPAFDQSNVDGYAIRFSEKDHSLTVGGEMMAGSDIQSLDDKTAIRIFTGAPVPKRADTIVMQENTHVFNNTLTIGEPKLAKGMNIRPRGTDINRGEMALGEGTLLTAAAVGYLAAIGVGEVAVYKPPSVVVIVTGNELVPQGAVLRPGQVYESNAVTLRTALKPYGISPETVHCKDDLNQLTGMLQSALLKSNMVILTGGVSVGDYDFVSTASQHCGVTKLFHRVKQRPGKPLYFGMKDSKPVFGLPGNPSSVLTCFYEYVSLALDMYLHRKEYAYLPAILRNGYKKASGLTHFLKGVYDNGYVEILSAQESYRMSSFARSNCLVVLPEAEAEFIAGDKAQVRFL